MSRGRNNQMQWDNVGGSGLSDAVGNAAVATAGLVEANNGIAGLADKFINLGEGISKKATERRNKALDDYTNNLFNESLQGAMNEDGTVNSGKLIQNLQTFRARDKANGEFWGDEEVGKKIGELTLKYNDSFTRNLEAVRSAKARERHTQQNINIHNAKTTYDLAQSITTKKNQYLADWAELTKKAKILDIPIDSTFTNKVNNLVGIGDLLFKGEDEYGNPIILTAKDGSFANNIANLQEKISVAETDIINSVNELRKAIAEKEAEEPKQNAWLLQQLFKNLNK